MVWDQIGREGEVLVNDGDKSSEEEGHQRKLVLYLDCRLYGKFIYPLKRGRG
jgi:hypothetical protein